MVEKRIFDTMLASLMRTESSIRIIALIDKEGLPISFAIKSRKFKIKPDKLGSLITQAFFPIDNYAKNLNLKSPLVQIYILEEGSLIVINLGIAILGILFDSSGWPLEPKLFDELFLKLIPQLRKASKTEDGLLSKITGEQDSSTALESISTENINKTLSILRSLSEGKMDPLLTMESAPAPEIFTKAGSSFDAFLVDEDNSILSMNPNYGPEFVLCIKEALDIQLGGLSGFNSGKVLCGLSYYFDGTCIINGIMGFYEKKNIFMFKKFTDWSIGFKSLISPFYSVANYLVADFASDESMNFIETIVYLTEPIDALKDRINSYVKSKDFEIARDFMKRAAILSLRQKDFIGAGDLYKWIAFTLYKEGNIEKSMNYYSEAAKYHNLGGDYEKSGSDYQDLANILSNQNKISEAIENYISAETEYKKTGKENLLKEITDLKNSLLSEYTGKIEDFVKNSTGETLTFSYIAQKFKFKDIIIISILNQLINDGKIGGEVDVDRGRYTKIKMLAKKTEVQMTDQKIGTNTQQSQQLKKPSLSSSVIGSSSINIDDSKFQPLLSDINGKLKEKEKEFEKINLPFLKYLEYERLLDRKELLELKMRIKENQNALSEENLCYICLKPMTPKDTLGSCPNKHKAHQSCLSVWIKSQDTCPICDSPLFPEILKTTYINTYDSIGSKDQNQVIINQLQDQIISLQEQNAHLEKLSSTLKDMKGDDKNYFDKLIRERELKEGMERELKRKDLTIRELKSMIKLFKQS